MIHTITEAIKSHSDYLYYNGKAIEAVDFLKKNVANNPHDLVTKLNLAVFLARCMGDYLTAYEYVKEGLVSYPANDDIRFLYSLILLKLGRWDEAWPYYESRPEMKLLKSKYSIVKQLKYLNDIKGKTLLITAAQGFGDIINFSRYINKLQALDVKIILDFPEPVRPIINPMYFHSFYEEGDNYDRWISLMSLPGLFSLTPDRIEPMNDVILIDKFKYSLSNQIAYNFQGNPQQVDNVYRSIPKNFIEAIQHPKAELININHESTNLKYNNFKELSNILTEMRLVVSACTATAHLAASMNLPTILLLKKYPCWRWFDTGETTDWYPSMIIFRQENEGSWLEPLKRTYEYIESII